MKDEKNNEGEEKNKFMGKINVCLANPKNVISVQIEVLHHTDERVILELQ